MVLFTSLGLLASLNTSLAFERYVSPGTGTDVPFLMEAKVPWALKPFWPAQGLENHFMEPFNIENCPIYVSKKNV